MGESSVVCGDQHLLCPEVMDVNVRVTDYYGVIHSNSENGKMIGAIKRVVLCVFKILTIQTSTDKW